MRPRSGSNLGLSGARAILVLAGIAALAATATIGNASSGATPAEAQYSPANVSAPTISGTATENQRLSASTGVWLGGGVTFAYQWRRCDRSGNGCDDIRNANAASYTLQASDVGKTLRVRVTASNRDGRMSSTSAATAVVAGAGPAGGIRLPNGETSIPVASVALPNRLVITDVAFSPNPVRVSSGNPITVRVKVKDSRGFVVRDAMIFVRSTPEVTGTPAEAATQQDGWATLTTVPQTDFPRNPAYNVQVFVRARKSGENPLAGISTRRLVQFGLTR